MEDIAPGNRLYFSCMPSLLHIASVKIVTNLLHDSDIGEMLDKASPVGHRGFEPWRYELWKSIERTAESKLPPLPPDLGATVAKFIRPMYYEVVHWLLDHDIYFHGYIHFFIKCNIFCWKSNGLIDREKTAKEIIQKDYFHLKDLFFMACTYYLTHEIIILWNRLKNVRHKRLFRKEGNPAVRFWMNYLKEGQNMDELTRKYFNPLRLEPKDIHFRLSCYFRFIPWEFSQEYLIGPANIVIHNDDFILCLNQMGQAERMELFQSNPTKVLTSCIRWPFYSGFIQAVREFSSYLTLEDFGAVLDRILSYYILEGFDCYELFKEFWNTIPESYKDEIKNDEKKFDIIQKTLNYKNIKKLNSLLESIAKYYYP